MTCYLVERSLNTLGIRVEKQNMNALLIARHPQANPLVGKCITPPGKSSGVIMHKINWFINK
jgi:cystathionine beta-lyase/cystathionine gamma-synthase